MAWRRWTALAGIVVSIGLLAALFGTGLGHDPNRLPATLVGRPAPAFTLSTVDGATRVRLSDLGGQVVLLNFWASWCVACQQEEPVLRDTFERYRGRGVTVLAISFQDSAGDARSYSARHAIEWPLLDDPGSRTGLAYGVTGLPETYFIGPDGRVARKEAGPVTGQLVTQEVSRLLAGAGR